MSIVKDYHVICKEIYESAKQYPTAVFAIKGDVYMMGSATVKFMRYLREYPNSFVGVYDERCTLKMIQDDIL